MDKTVAPTILAIEACPEVLIDIKPEMTELPMKPTNEKESVCGEFIDSDFEQNPIALVNAMG